MRADGVMRLLGRSVPEDLIDAIPASDLSDSPALHLARDGWLLVRDAIDADLVWAAREAVLERLVAVGEIEPPPSVGLATGQSRRREVCGGDLGRFWAEVSGVEAMKRLTSGPELHDLAATLLGCPARPADFVWLRVKGRGVGAPLRRLHDYLRPREAPALLAWVPLGPIEFHQGPPFVYDARLGDLPDRAALPLRPSDPHLKTARFEAGDVLFLAMDTVFGAFDNDTNGRRVRASCECLWRPADAPHDPRFDGPSPTGPDGRGYGGLPSALPLSGG